MDGLSIKRRQKAKDRYIPILSTTIHATEISSELFKGYYPSIKNRSTNLKTPHINLIQNLFYSLISKENLQITESLDILFCNIFCQTQTQNFSIPKVILSSKTVLPCLFLVLHKPTSLYISPYSINTVFTFHNKEFAKFLYILCWK